MQPGLDLNKTKERVNPKTHQSAAVTKKVKSAARRTLASIKKTGTVSHG